MAHAHEHGVSDGGRAFALGVAFNLAFVVVEAVAGIAIGSLALVADAGHNLSDVLGLLVAWIAYRLSRRPPTNRRTYGLRRSSILAALVNAGLLLIAVGGIAWEAFHRLARPEAVEGGAVILVASAGVLVNAMTALLFAKDRKSDLNVRGAFLHMVADAGVSFGVIVGGIAISLTGKTWIDPAMSLAIAMVITAGTWGLLRRALDLALDAVPEGIDPMAVRAFLAQLPEVAEVHDLHIWAMSTTETALTAHLVRPDGRVDDAWLARVREELHDRFAIEHATLQVESGCGKPPCEVPEAESRSRR
jgi:cobalt-zinc-cadmium efflux system protein